MQELLERWSKLEPERAYIIEDGCGTGTWGITYAGSDYKVALGHDVNELVRGAPEQIEYDVQDDGAVIVAIFEGLAARGWDWIKDDWGAEAYVVTPRVGNKWRCNLHDRFALNLLDAYLQALEAQ